MGATWLWWRRRKRWTTKTGLRAFAEMKYALDKNNDGLTVYGVLTDAKEWCILSLAPDLVPRLSTSLYLDVQAKYADGQLEDLVNTLCAVFLLAITQVSPRGTAGGRGPH